MKISLEKSLNFNRRLKSSEKKEYLQILNEGKQKVGNTGMSMLIVPSSSLPQSMQNNIGVGNILSQESKDFFDFAKQYWGINSIQLLPEGAHNYKYDTFRPYSGTSLDLGIQLINFDLLTTENYGKILDKNDINNLVKQNDISDIDNIVNSKNIMGRKSNAKELLEKAYDNFMNSDSLSIKKMREEFEQYKISNKSWLEPKAVFQSLIEEYNTSNFHNWEELDSKLYDTEVVSIQSRNARINKILGSKSGKAGKIYEFSQYLADKHLSEAKKNLNSHGIELYGDALLHFSKDEVWANPDAFIKDVKTCWGFHAFNYESEIGEKLLRLKFRNFAKRYDGIRVDAAWTYVEQPLFDTRKKYLKKIYHDEKNLKIIEDEIKKVKGKNYKMSSIIFEFEADPKVFNINNGNKLRHEIENRIKIYKSDYLSLINSWGSTHAYKLRGWKDGTYLFGTTNHDSEPMKTTFNNLNKRNEQIEALSEILKIDKKKLQTLPEFKQAKFAEALRCKHNMFFFTEGLNLDGRYKDNLQDLSKDYKIKIPHNYEDKFFLSLINGESYNPMDALEKIFIAEGYDKTDPKLYKKIVKFKKILQAPEKKQNPKLISLLTLCLSGATIASWLAIKLVKKKKALKEIKQT